MKDYKLIREDGDTFTVDDGSGRPFRVPKARLAHSTVKRISKHFADGGEVPEMADLTEDERAKALEDAYKKYDPTGFLRHGGDPTQQGTDPTLPDLAPLVTQDDADKANARRMPAASDPDMAPATPVPSTGPGMLARPPDEPVRDPAAFDMSAGPLDVPIAPLVPPQRSVVMPQFPADNTAQQIRAATEQGAQGIASAADARAGGMRIQADIQQDAAQRQAAAAEWERKYLDTANAEQEKKFQEYMDPKNDINPHQWWESRNTGQKIAAVIGMALGGMGAALTHTPNFAMEMIKGAIGRDLDAQKMNLGRKQNALAMRAGMTKDYLSGRHLAAADAYTAAAAMVMAQGTQAQSEAERANAQTLAAQLRAAGAEHIQQAGMRTLQMQQERINLGLAQQHAQAMGKLLNGLSGGGGFDRRTLEMPGFEKYRERAVDLPDGTVALADDTKQADETRDSMAKVSSIKAKLTRYMGMLNSGSPETIDRGTAQAQYSDLLSEIGHLHDLNRLSDKDLELFKDQVPDISRWFSLKSLDRQKLRSLGKSIDDKVWSRNKQLLHFPDSARPGGG